MDDDGDDDALMDVENFDVNPVAVTGGGRICGMSCLLRQQQLRSRPRHPDSLSRGVY